MSLFSQVRTKRPGYSAFNLSHERKQSMTMGTLTPFYLQEILPGDRIRVNSETFLRMAPTLAPIMHRVNVTVHYFFVPNRILWDNWKDFITGGEDGDNASTVPTIDLTQLDEALIQKKTLWDYMGLPVPVAPMDPTATISINALPFRAYQEIYNEYYRDQNLQDKVVVDKGDNGSHNYEAMMTLRNRNWEKDYFTSCLPFAQKGNPVSAPIGFAYDPTPIGSDGLGNNLDPGDTLTIGSDGAAITSPSGSAFVLENIDPDSTGIDVNELRQAVRLQEWLETNARAGSRYVESIQAHFNERVPDYTAQRPIFLGGGKVPVNISEVLSTYSGQNANTHDLPQGNMAGHGVAIGNTNRFKAKFSEHGFVMGIMSVTPRTAYQNGRNRMWNRQSKFDFYWPEFAQLGEQAVDISELFYDFGGNATQGTFGYQSRYADYKFAMSQVAGDFRDNLAYWHMGRIFSQKPALNGDFVEADPRKDIYAVTDNNEDELYVQVYNNVKALRKMPKHNVPTL